MKPNIIREPNGVDFFIAPSANSEADAAFFRSYFQKQKENTTTHYSRRFLTIPKMAIS